MQIIGDGKSQINLIEAAEKSSFDGAIRGQHLGCPNPCRASPSKPQHNESYATLEKTGLEWTTFNLSWFLEYYSMPHVDTYILQTTFVVDMANKFASIPGDGNQMIFTCTRDVAKFVVAALDLPNESATHMS
ncbi:uncharacterized protein BKA55DRAFT_722774 [Fusarium redolens]|uniref:NmrA-like domain-containing protein n=1 Tax=Fusarium redolens TaxID=48865 RepID=A0A9P9FWA2_FUSRE|nr:uncharacterized protein BKA55DRAFT_722774 [Fusarium redolens]KAH7205107.1 hypothetical protein BKA55DRAFT_722774 [Fusarium redolens]